jgi:proteasome lid subunit RPN8/RPN11
MTTPVVRLPDDLRRRIVDHCRAALPNEGCGLLAMDGDVVVEVYPTANDDASPLSYTIPPEEHYRALIDVEGRGWRLGGVFHSHPSGPAVMSSLDVTRAVHPEWVYVVVGADFEVAAWQVAEGMSRPVALAV